jgi:hypothetical protein
MMISVTLISMLTDHVLYGIQQLVFGILKLIYGTAFKNKNIKINKK